jgi:hypothetical protein
LRKWRIPALAAGLCLSVGGGLGLAGAGVAQASPAAHGPIRPSAAVLRVSHHTRAIAHGRGSLYAKFLAKERAKPLVTSANLGGRRHEKPAPAAGRPVHATAAVTNVTSHGGPVQHTPEVTVVFWGPNWVNSSDPEFNAATYYTNFLCDLGIESSDAWSTTQNQYYDSTGAPYSLATGSGGACGGSLTGVYYDTSTPPFGATGAQLGAEADTVASNLGLTDTTNTQLIIATQSGTCPQGFDAVANPACASEIGSSPYCAWHSNSASNWTYTNLPFMPDAGFNCSANGTAGNLDGYSIVGGHEWTESVTDPKLNAWFDSSGAEDGDKCAWMDLQTTTFTSPVAMSVKTQPIWDNAISGCSQSSGLSGPVVGYGGKCLDDYHSSVANNNKVDIFGCNNSDAQMWTHFGDGTLRVLGRCLDDTKQGGSGTKQELFACNGGTNQEWTHLSTAQYQLKLDTSLCLNDPGNSTTDGTQQIIYACSQNGANEHWTLPG